MRNAILIDFLQSDNWNFNEAIESVTEEKWEVIDSISNMNHGNFMQKIIRYFKYFWFPFKIFLKRYDFKKIIAWQQFYGMILAFYCRLFHVKTFPDVYIMTFIYKPKGGIIGNIYDKFIRYSLKSDCIKKIFVFSTTEPLYYSKLLQIDSSLFETLILGEEDKSNKFSSMRNSDIEKYYLSAGRSNRDYEFLKAVWKSKWGKLKIITDSYPAQSIGNIEFISNCFGDDYLKYLSECYAVVLSLENEEISSGQLVVLQACMFGKPVIATHNKAMPDYIDEGRNGYIIEKKEEDLSKLIHLLDCSDIYDACCREARIKYEKDFSLYSMGIKIGNVIRRY